MSRDLKDTGEQTGAAGTGICTLRPRNVRMISCSKDKREAYSYGFNGALPPATIRAPTTDEEFDPELEREINKSMRG